MKRHVFITARPQPIPRWLQAFPDALILQEANAVQSAFLASAAIIWLHATTDEQLLSTLIKSVRAAANNVPIVVLSNVPEDEQGTAALAAGASGYCSALTLPEVLHQVANVVEHGGLWVGPQLMRRLMQGLAAHGNDSAVPSTKPPEHARAPGCRIGGTRFHQQGNRARHGHHRAHGQSALDRIVRKTRRTRPHATRPPRQWCRRLDTTTPENFCLTVLRSNTESGDSAVKSYR